MTGYKYWLLVLKLHSPPPPPIASVAVPPPLPPLSRETPVISCGLSTKAHGRRERACALRCTKRELWPSHRCPEERGRLWLDLPVVIPRLYDKNLPIPWTNRDFYQTTQDSRLRSKNNNCWKSDAHGGHVGAHIVAKFVVFNVTTGSRRSSLFLVSYGNCYTAPIRTKLDQGLPLHTWSPNTDGLIKSVLWKFIVTRGWAPVFCIK